MTGPSSEAIDTATSALEDAFERDEVAVVLAAGYQTIRADVIAEIAATLRAEGYTSFIGDKHWVPRYPDAADFIERELGAQV